MRISDWSSDVCSSDLLALMLAGRKPAAMFYDVVPASIDLPEADFAPHVTAGRLVRREEIYAGRDGGRAMRYVYYVLPGEMQRLEQLHAINAAIYSGQRQATEADDIRSEKHTSELQS